MTIVPPADMGHPDTGSAAVRNRLPPADQLVLTITGVVALLTTILAAFGSGLGAMALDVCAGESPPAKCSSWGVAHSATVLWASWAGTFIAFGLATALTISGRRWIGWPLALLAPTLPFFGLSMAFP